MSLFFYLGVFLVVFLPFFGLSDSSVQRISHREKNQVLVSYHKPRTYPCMTDWKKTCRKDSDCCSGLCLDMFCKILGVEVTTTPRPRPRRRGTHRTRGRGRGRWDQTDRKTEENVL